MYVLKNMMGDVRDPKQVTLAKIKRFTRLLIGISRVEWHFPLQDFPLEVYNEADNDCGADPTTRRSTTGTMPYFGTNLLEATSVSQSVIAEWRGRAVCDREGHCDRHPCEAVVGGMCTAVRNTVASYITAGRIMDQRTGSGKAREGAR